MKVIGIILVIFGSLATLGAILVAVNGGDQASFVGIVWIVLGAFLISRGNKKKEAELKKKEWTEE